MGKRMCSRGWLWIFQMNFMKNTHTCTHTHAHPKLLAWAIRITHMPRYAADQLPLCISVENVAPIDNACICKTKRRATVMSTINVNCCGKPPFPTHCSISICTCPVYLPLTELSCCSSPQFAATLRMRNYMIWYDYFLFSFSLLWLESVMRPACCSRAASVEASSA